MANDQASIAEGYNDFLRDLKQRIRSAQVQAVLALYPRVGITELTNWSGHSAKATAARLGS